MLWAVFLFTMVIPAGLIDKSRDTSTNHLYLDGSVELGMSVAHGAITITGDAELAAFPDKSGSGNVTDPYVISGFTINGPGTSPSQAIKISNTTAFLVIKDCVLSNTNDSFINYWTNNVGLRISYCTNVNITGNTFTRCKTAISILSSNNCVVTGNYMQPDDGLGVFLTSCNGIIISENNMTSCSIGVNLYLSHQNDVSRNYIRACSEGVRLYSANNNSISGNVITQCIDGILLEISIGNNIRGNRLSLLQTSGINLAESNNNTIVRNFVWTCDLDTIGSVYTRSVIFVIDSTGNTISCNAFWGRAYSHLGNMWDNGTHGNFWGDYYAKYQGRAIMYGGFWDTPYEISPPFSSGSGCQDVLPLVYLPDYDPPLIYSQITMDFLCGVIGKEVVWMPMVETMNVIDEFTHSYSLYKDGLLLRTGTWSAGSLINVNLNWIATGVYNYTIVVSDGLGGVARDTVIVAVRPGIFGMDEFTFYLLVAIIAIGILVVLSIARARGKLRRRVKESGVTREQALGHTGLETLAALAKSESTITVSRLAELLAVKETFVWENIARWANQFGFFIQKDMVTFRNGNIEAFVDDLDKKFTEWDKNTRDKLGKK